MACKARGILDFYQCVDNLWEVKNLVNYTLRFSLAATLARKYKTSIKKIFAKYGKHFNIKIGYKGKTITIADFPSKTQVSKLKYKFNSKVIKYCELNTKLKSFPLDTFFTFSLDFFKICGVNRRW